MGDIKALLGLDIDESIKQVETDLKKIKKELDGKHKIEIRIEVKDIDKQIKELQKYQDAISKIAEERKKLNESTGNVNNVNKIDALKVLEQKEKELAVQREQLLKDYALLQETITKARIESLERINTKEQQTATKTEESLNRQATAFQRMYGTLKEGVTLPIKGGTDDISTAIRQMEGFADANVKAIGSVQVGEITLDRYIATLQNTGGGFDTFKISVDNSTGAVYQLSQGLKSTDTALIRANEVANGVINGLASALVASGITKSLDEIKDTLWECVEASIEFESALAGIKRTVGGTDSEIKIIGDGIKELTNTIPITTSQFGLLGEQAGQLGIERPDLLSFVEVIAKLGTVTDASAEQVGKMLAEFSNITQLPQSDFERMGSTIALLGDSTAATTTKISDIALRIAAAGSIAGFSARDIISLSATIGSLGIQAEAGGSSMSKLIGMMQKAVETGEMLEDFAHISNMSIDDFTNKWGTDAIGALNAFVQGLNDVDRIGSTAIVTLNNMGVNEIRLTRSILALAQSGDMLKNIIDKSNEAWNSNTALTEKADIIYNTVASRMALLENATQQLQIAIGDSLTPTINSAVGGLTDFTLGMEEFVKENKWLVQSLTVLGVLLGTMTAGVTIYTVGLKALTAVKLALAAAAGTAAKANMGLMATFLATPLGPVILALSAISAGITAITIATSENSKVNQESLKIAKENSNALRTETNELELQKAKIIELRKALSEGNLTQSEATKTREELYSIQKSLSEQYGQELSDINLVTGAINEQIDALNKLAETKYKKFTQENKNSIDTATDYFEKPKTEIYTKVGIKYDDILPFKDILDNLDIGLKSRSQQVGLPTAQLDIKGSKSEILQKYRDLFDVITKESENYEGKAKESGEKVLSEISKIIVKKNNEFEKYENIYKQSIEGLIKYNQKYNSEYALILNARTELDKAQLSDNEENIKEAQTNLFEALNKGIDKADGNNYIADYFRNMYSDIQTEFDKYQFEISFDVNKNDVADDIKSILKSLPKKSDDILKIDSIGGSQKQIESFSNLKDVAEKYNLQVRDLITSLIKLNMVEASPIVELETINPFIQILDEVNIKVDLLSQALDEQSQIGQITSETYNKLIANGEEYEKLLTIQGDKIVLLTEDTSKFANEQIDAAIKTATLNNATKDEIAQLNNLRSAFDNISLDDATSTLVSHHNLIKLIKDEYKDFKSISLDTLEKIRDAYPELEKVLFDYMEGIISYEQLIKHLESAYENDVNAFKRAVLEKKKLDTDFYKSVISNIDKNTIELAKKYGIQLDQYTNYAKAKLEIDAKYTQKSNELADLQARYQKIINEDIVDNFRDSKNIILENMASFQGSKLNEFESKLGEKTLKDISGKQKELNDIKKLIESFDTSFLSNIDVNVPVSNNKDKDSNKDKFKETFNWADIKLKELNNEIAKLKQNFEDALTSSEQQTILDQMIAKEQEKNKILKDYIAVAKKHESELLKKVPDKYKDVAQTGQYKLETFKGESGKKILEDIKNYRSFREQVQGLNQDLQEQESIINDLNSQKISIVVKYYTSKEDELRGQLANKTVSKKQNSILDNLTQVYKDEVTKLTSLQKDLQKQANELKKGLSSKTVKAIENNTLDKLSPKELEKANNYLNALKNLTYTTNEIINARANISNTAVEKFNNIADDYDRKITRLQNEAKQLQNVIDTTTAQGGFTTELMYKNQIANEKAILKQYEKRKKKLEELLTLQIKNGEIKVGSKVGSDKWHELNNQIIDTKNNIDDVNLSIIELNNNIRQLKFENFDRAFGKLTDVSEELEFLIGLLDSEELTLEDDEGNFLGLSKEGLTKLGLLTQSLESAKVEAEELSKFMMTIDKDDPEYSKYVNDFRSKINEIHSIESAIADAMKVKYDAQIKSLEDKIKKYKEIIDAAKKALRAEKDLHGYQKSIDDKTKDINKIQKRILELNLAAQQGDRKAIAEKTKLEEELAKLQNDLTELQYDHEIKLAEDALDARLEAYEKEIRDEIKLLEKKSQSEKQMIEEATQLVKDSSNSIYEGLDQLAREHGVTISDMITSSWTNAITVMDEYKKKLDEIFTKYKDINIEIGVKDALDGIPNISDIVEDVIGNTNNANKNTNNNNSDGLSLKDAVDKSPVGNIKDIVDTIKDLTADKSKEDTKVASTQGNGKVEVGDKVTFDSGKYYALSDGTGASGTKNLNKDVYVTKVNSGSAYPYHISTGKSLGNGDLGWVKKKQIKGYSQGGMIDETGLFVGHGTKTKPEYVLNAEQTKGFMQLLPAMENIIDYSKIIGTNGVDKVKEMIEKVTKPKLDMLEYKPMENVVNVNMHYDNFLNVQGNLDHVTLDDVRGLKGEFSDYMTKGLTNEMRKHGFHR